MGTFSSKSNSFMAAIIILLGLLAANLDLTGAACLEPIGVCYGMLGNNLPSKQEVINLYKSNNIRKMRLYDPNPEALQALRDSNIEVIVGVPNSDLQYVSNPSNAQSWVQRNILSYWPNVKFKYISVGNEVNPLSNDGFAQYVRPAIVNIFNAIRSAGLTYQISVSTSIGMTLLGNSYPPSDGAFRGDVRSYLDPIIGHLAYAGAPLLVNVYPYFAYSDNPKDISLSYATFNSPSAVVNDRGRGYQNLFDAMVDAVYAALEHAGQGSLSLVVSESGWPSRGRRAGTSPENAQTYLRNLVRRARSGVGTPKRPGAALDIYMFAMFDENQKGSDEEDSFGLFYPNKQPKYNLNFGGSGNYTWDDSDSSEFNATVSDLKYCDM